MCTMEKWLQAERDTHFKAWLWDAGQQPQLLNLVVFRALFPIGTTAFFGTQLFQRRVTAPGCWI